MICVGLGLHKQVLYIPHTLASSRSGYMFIRQSTKKLRVRSKDVLHARGTKRSTINPSYLIARQGQEFASNFLRRHSTSLNSVIATISTDSAYDTPRPTTKMMITDQEATELKSWVVKKLEDMYAAPPSMPAS